MSGLGPVDRGRVHGVEPSASGFPARGRAPVNGPSSLGLC